MRTPWTLTLLLLLSPSIAPAQWIPDGVKLLDDVGNSVVSVAAPDGSGGAFFAAQAYTPVGPYPYDVFLQRIDAHGRLLYSLPVPQVTFALDANHQSVALASDEAGSAYLATHSYFGSTYAIRLSRYDDSGNRIWSTMPGSSSSTDLVAPKLAFDSPAGALFVLAKGWNNNHLYLSRVDPATGLRTWGTGAGIQVTTGSATLGTYLVAPDGTGGCIVVWIDSRNGNPDIFAQRFDATATAVWTPGGVNVCDHPSTPSSLGVVPDAAGGAYLVWADTRDTTQRVIGQRITAAGTAAWTANGIPLSSVLALQFEPVAIGDGSGGLIVAWRDLRTGHWDMMGNRFDRNGTARWNAAGAILCGVNSSKYGPSLVSDGAGGGILGWHDFRNGNSDIYVQRFDGNSALYYATEAVALCTDAAAQQPPVLVSDAAGGAVAIWRDPRVAADEFYAQRVDRFGNWGFPAPIVEAVEDVPADQGGKVVVGWGRSRLDDWATSEVRRYTVWRELSLGAARAISTPDLEVAESANLPLRLDATGQSSYWEKVGEVEAVSLPRYAMTVPTLRDSTAADPGVIAFRVIAHGAANGEYWLSMPLSGWSVDDLAPLAPQGFAGQASYQPLGLVLRWRRNTEADLVGYRLYRGTSADFVPSPAELVVALSDTTTFDPGWTAGSHYKVTALDAHGNESPWSSLAPGVVTATDDAPRVVRLLGCAPNPFNPSTVVRFELPQECRVSLRIFDARGRLVRELVDELRGAGAHAVRWDGRDGQGRSLASGRYFCRLEAAGAVVSSGMALLR